MHAEYDFCGKTRCTHLVDLLLEAVYRCCYNIVRRRIVLDCDHLTVLEAYYETIARVTRYARSAEVNKMKQHNSFVSHTGSIN